MTNAADGREIIIPWQGVKHALSGRVTDAAVSAVRHLESLIERAAPQAAEADRHGRRNVEGIQPYVVAATLDGQPVTLRIITREVDDGTRYYDHFEISESPSPGERVRDGRESIQVVEGPSDGRVLPAGDRNQDEQSRQRGEDEADLYGLRDAVERPWAMVGWPTCTASRGCRSGCARA